MSVKEIASVKLRRTLKVDGSTYLRAGQVFRPPFPKSIQDEIRLDRGLLDIEYKLVEVKQSDVQEFVVGEKDEGLFSSEEPLADPPPISMKGRKSL